MLDRNVRFEGFDTEDWTRLLELMRSDPATEPDAGLIVVHEAGRVLKSYRTGGGTPVEHGERWPQPLAELGRRAAVRWVLAARAGALDAWSAGLARRIRPGDDMLDQLILAWQQARQLAVSGQMDTWPTSLASIPVPTRGVWLSAVGWICPPRQSLVLAAWDGGELWTSLVLRRSDAGFDRIVGPDGLRDVLGNGTLKPEEMWQRLKERVSSALGPIGVGVAGDRGTWQQMGTWREPGRWARAVASGQMVLDPFPRGLALPLALDASRMALLVVRSALGRRFGAAGSEGDDALGADFASLWRVAEGLWTLQRRGR